MSTIPHLLLISSFHYVSDHPSFISSYYVSIPSQPCFHFFVMSTIPHLLLISSFHVSDRLSFMSYITCPYHLNLASLTFSAMSTTPHLLISSFCNVSDQISFVASYYVPKRSQRGLNHHIYPNNLPLCECLPLHLLLS